MAVKTDTTDTSMDDILTFDNRDASQWSVVWSTTHIPGMDIAMGNTETRRVRGRRRLRVATFALGAFYTMHCRLTAAAVTGGFFIFMLFLVVAVALLANPLRHFEVYLGQWSISGPGRAFRIIPMLDGIGIAICINAIVRAIICCAIAAISLIYVFHAVGDDKLPFTYCSHIEIYNTGVEGCKDVGTEEDHDAHFNVNSLVMKRVMKVLLGRPLTLLRGFMNWARTTLEKLITEFDDDDEIAKDDVLPPYVANLYSQSLRSFPFLKTKKDKNQGYYKVEVCKESYAGKYPPLFSTPAYNFFYVEVVRLRSDFSLGEFNLYLVLSIVLIWIVLWVILIYERIHYGRLVWNNTQMWFVILPWCWSAILLAGSLRNLSLAPPPNMNKALRIGAKEVLSSIGDAFEIAMYIHSASTGTEIIHGKGLNYFASGHIDPLLNTENVWHSAMLLLLSALHSSGTAIVCALVDTAHVSLADGLGMQESTLWMIPMYSKCISHGNYSHLLSVIIFGGLTFSYMFVAYLLLKTALHAIFEYKVKLVFVEQAVVGALIVLCIGLSIPFATNGGVALLESVDTVISGVGMPLLCLLEVLAMLHVYRGRDFQSDLNLATEDNACGNRINMQWQMLPFVVFVTLVLKIVTLVKAELPEFFIYVALIPLGAMIAAVPLRALHNALMFMRLRPRTNN